MDLGHHRAATTDQRLHVPRDRRGGDQRAGGRRVRRRRPGPRADRLDRADADRRAALDTVGLGAQCCTLAASSTAFVPPANATTQVAVALPMRNDLNPAFGETVDSLALTVLSRDVIVPLARGAGATGSLAFHPELLPSDAGHSSSGVGAVPLLNGDLVPCATTNRCTGLALTVANRVPTLVRLANGATLPALCALAGPGTCVVVATVPGLAAAAAKRTTVGRGKVTLTAAGRRPVKVTFTKAFRRAIGARRRSLAIRLEATATVTAPVPSSSKATRTVTVRAGR